ncbi:MAG: hypothetical protein ACRDD6_05245 [Tannerellaceae bacterium]
MCVEIKYIGYFEDYLSNSKYKRSASLAAVAKMTYISKVLSELGYRVNIISLSHIEGGNGFEFGTTKRLFEKVILTKCLSWGVNNRISLYFRILYTYFWLFVKLLAVRRGEKILVYHSPWLALPIQIAKWLRGFDVLLEIEEIYADISSINSVFDKLEYYLIENSDCYLISSDLIKVKLNSQKKTVVLYGQYDVAPNLGAPKLDSKIHLLYAGIIDSEKAGAFNAIKAAEYLDENYVLHIVGFGEVDLLLDRIESVKKKTQCQIQYDGIKTGEEFIKYTQEFHIGLSTQNMVGCYLNSSFPSKILSYLCLGLNVVSCDIKCVRESAIGDLVTYYSDDSDDALAIAIKNMEIRDKEFIRYRINVENTKFKLQLRGLL